MKFAALKNLPKLMPITAILLTVSTQLCSYCAVGSKFGEIAGTVVNQKQKPLGGVEVRVVTRDVKTQCGEQTTKKDGGFKVQLSTDCPYATVQFEKSGCHNFSVNVTVVPPSNNVGTNTMDCPGPPDLHLRTVILVPVKGFLFIMDHVGLEGPADGIRSVMGIEKKKKD